MNVSDSPQSAVSDSTLSAAPERPGEPAPAGLKGWFILTGTVLVLLVAAYYVQLAQPPCGKPLDAPPAVFSAGWLTCPVEENQFNRDRASVAAGYLTSVHFSADGQVGGVVGPGNAVILTRDGGQTWQAQPAATDQALYAVRFAADGQYGVAVGAQAAIVVTRDGGRHWTAPDTTGVTGRSSLLSVHLTDDGKRGWAAGDDGAIVATHDGGVSWQSQSSGSAYRLLDIHFNGDAERGWAVGAGGPILATRDGGIRWAPLDGIGGYFSSIDFAADGMHGWTVGMGQTILASDDGGASWKSQGRHGPALLHAVHFTPDGTRGWVVGAKGVILATTDGGQNWQRQINRFENELTNVHFSADGKRGWAVGFQGTILGSADGGATWQRSGIYTRGVPRWYVAAAAILLLACFGALVGRIAAPGVNIIEDRIAFEAVADAPLERADQDLLGFSKIADAVAAFLRHERTRPSLTIAVTAAWGQGKSSMMGLMRARLKAEGTPTVWFNVWHHQKEPVLLAALLAAVVAQGIPPALSRHGLIFRGKLVWIRFRKRPFAGALPALLFVAGSLGLIFLAVSMLLTSANALFVAPAVPAAPGPHPVFARIANLAHDGIAAIAGNPAVEALLSGEWARFVRESFGAFSSDPSKVVPLAIAAILLGSAFLLVTHFWRPFPANPGALLFSLGNKFNLAQAEDQTTLRQRFREHFMDVTRALQPRTLTIFIDDIDRCDPDKAAETLEAVNYLTDSGLCFVVLGMAREIVEAQLGEAHGTVAERAAEFDQARQDAHAGPVAPRAAANTAQLRLDYARKYLKKLIQIEVPVPVFGSPEMQALLASRGAADDTPREQRRMADFLRLCDKLQRYRETGWRAVRFAVPVIVAMWVVFQGTLWLEVQDKKKRDMDAAANQKIADAESELTAKGRKYVWALRREVAEADSQRMSSAVTPAVAESKVSKPAELVPVSMPAAAATTKAAPAPAAASTQSPAERSSRLREAERWLDQAEKATDRMKEHQRNGLRTARDAADMDRLEAQARLAALEKDDVDYQARLKEAASRSKVASAAVVAEPPPKQSQPAAKPPAVKRVPTELVIPTGLLLILALAGLVLGRDRYSIKEKETYKQAVRWWQPVLLERDAMRAPREAKRFLNLSRYLTLRVNADQYFPWSWRRRRLAAWRKVDPPDTKKAVDEAVIVALTTLLMTRPKHIQGIAVEQFLRHPGTIKDPVNPFESAEAAYAKAVLDALHAAGLSSHAPPWSPDDVSKFINAAGELRHSPAPVREPAPH